MERQKAIIIVIVGFFFLSLLFLSFFILIIGYFKKLYRMRAERQHLEAKIAEEVNNARNEIQQLTLNNISQEIHDNVGQLLSLAKMQLNLIAESPEKNMQLIEETKDNISKAMSDLRDLAKGMSSDRIKLLGLYDSVVHEAERINKAGALQVEVTCSGVKKEPDHQKQLVIFRVIQECFQNIIKHAQAAHVVVSFSYQLDTFDISIEDDGRGFDYNPENPTTGGLGLMNIFNRVNLVGGSAKVNSAPGKGTRIFLHIPIG
jgi:signal transduction histidine kinase